MRLLTLFVNRLVLHSANIEEQFRMRQAALFRSTHKRIDNRWKSRGQFLLSVKFVVLHALGNRSRGFLL